MGQEKQTEMKESLFHRKNDEVGLIAFLEQSATYVSHLHELRIRLIVSAVAFLAAAIIGWSLNASVLQIFQRSVDRLIFIAPAEAFFVRIKIAAAIGLVLAAPIIVYQLWAFVAPGLFPEERRAVKAFLWMGLPLFGLGLLFGYTVVYPVALRFFLAFGTEGLKPAIVVSRHLGFFMGTTLTFGLAFQLPTVLLILVRVGILDVARLRAWRRPGIFVMFVVATVLTPADVVSQFLMAIPLIVLYELTLVLAPRFEKRGMGQ